MIHNPILSGFNPDPSICKVGDDYYIATSTFEWYPGIMIYHSSDLINWQLIATPMKGQVNLKGDRNSGGLWAPHLTYADGLFWLMITDMKTDQLFKDTLNYLMTSKKIDGDWGEATYINSSGFDPSLFHDEDGKKYILNMLWDYRPYKPNFNGIILQEYDVEKKSLIGERKCIFKGTKWGVTEGPQIFKKDGYYYLVCAEGGTGYNHATTVARAKKIEGPYEVSPYTPLITSKLNPELPIQKAGHASFVQVKPDEWYITHLCARPLTQRGCCVLGRETGIAKITWEAGWPKLATDGYKPSVTTEAPSIGRKSVQQEDFSTYTDFDESILPSYFQSLRIPLEKRMSLSKRKGCLRLYGAESIASLHEQTLVVRRWQAFCFRAETKLYFKPTNFQQMAGLTCFYNTENWMYAYVSYDETQQMRILSLLVAELGKTMIPLQVPYIAIPDDVEGICLAVEVNNEQLQFLYSFNGENYHNLGDLLPASHLSDDYIEQKSLVFTGAMVGMCVQDMDTQRIYADFEYFNYKESLR